jgi:glycosyltransferase involved in cell wall biosynthesis
MYKVAIDCRLLNLLQVTGISRYTLFLIDYYASRFKPEEILLITNNKDFHYGKFNVAYTSLKPYNLLHVFFFPLFIKRKKPILLHSPFYSGLFFKVKGIKSIVTVHDLMFRLVPDFFNGIFLTNFLKFKYYDLIVSRTIKNADEIISISETTKQDVLEYYGLNSKHIPEMSEINVKADNSILKTYSLTPKSFFFYCGNSRVHKNLDFVIDIFNKNVDLPTLVLAGKGHKNSNNVIFVGNVTDGQLRALYESTIAFIFPSKHEGFGLPILEALNSNTRVIASKISAFLEFKSKNISYFELGNELEFLSALKLSIATQFVLEDNFWHLYSQSNIYNLTDMLIWHVINTPNE